MDNNRDKHSSQEMDQIQQGVERFLAKEMRGYEDLQQSVYSASILVDPVENTEDEMEEMKEEVHEVARDEEENQASHKKSSREKKNLLPLAFTWHSAAMLHLLQRNSFQSIDLWPLHRLPTYSNCLPIGF